MLGELLRPKPGIRSKSREESFSDFTLPLLYSASFLPKLTNSSSNAELSCIDECLGCGGDEPPMDTDPSSNFEGEGRVDALFSPGNPEKISSSYTGSSKTGKEEEEEVVAAPPFPVRGSMYLGGPP